MQFKFIILFLTGLFCFTIMMISCTNPAVSEEPKSKTTITVIKYAGTQPPGDYWEWDINWTTSTNGTFTAKNFGTTLGKGTAKIYSGTTTLLASKFTSYIITDVSNDSNVHAGDKFYGVEIPGTAILVDAGGKLITCSVIGTAPVTETKYNWTRIPSAAVMDNHASTVNGILSYGYSTISQISGDSYSEVFKSYNWDGTLINNDEQSTCVYKDNKLYSPNDTSPVAVSVIANTGCFVTDMSTDGGLFGIIAPQTTLDLSNDALTKNYRGYAVVYNSSDPNNWSLVPLLCKPHVSNTSRQVCNVYLSNNVENAVDTNTEFEVDFSQTTKISEGLYTNISSLNSEPGFDENIIEAVNKVNNKYIVMGFGRVKKSNADPNYYWENFVLVQVD